MTAYKNLSDDEFEPNAYRYCFNPSYDEYRELLEFRNKKLAMTHDEIRGINAWNQRVNEGADLHSYFRHDRRIAELIRDFADGRDFRSGHILTLQQHKDLQYIYDKCSGNELAFLCRPSTPAIEDLRREACAKKYADKAFNDCSEPVKALINSKLDVLMRPELAESYVQALADGKKASWVPERVSPFSDRQAYNQLCTMVSNEQYALRETERKADADRVARGQAEHEKIMKELADRAAERNAALAERTLKAQQRRDDLAAQFKVEAEQRALVASEIQAREAKEKEEKDAIWANRKAEQKADSERVLRNRDREKMIFAGGVGVLGSAIAALVIVPKKYKVSVREVLSTLPKPDEFESIQDYQDTIAAIKSARNWLAGLGVLGTISALVAGAGYRNLERRV
jgi:hypothetical protein